jgi:hypothetical protein
VNIETNCCESMLITCFTSCLEMWDVIWEIRFRFIFCEIICDDSFSWSCLIISSSVFFDCLVSLLMSDAYSFSIIEWRMSVLDLSSNVYDETSLNLTRNLIKLIASDSSNLTKAIHRNWRRHLIKFDWSDSSNLTTSSHQTWRKRFIKFDRWYLIKLDEDFVCFLK